MSSIFAIQIVVVALRVKHALIQKSWENNDCEVSKFVVGLKEDEICMYRGCTSINDKDLVENWWTRSDDRMCMGKLPISKMEERKS